MVPVTSTTIMNLRMVPSFKVLCICLMGLVPRSPVITDPSLVDPENMVSMKNKESKDMESTENTELLSRTFPAHTERPLPHLLDKEEPP